MLTETIAVNVCRTTKLEALGHQYEGWLGVEAQEVRVAIGMMRALAVRNVLTRREGTVLFLPINPTSDPSGELIVQRAADAYDAISSAEAISN